MPTKKKRPLWTCPKCRHKFVTRNMSHSCGRYRVADHFKGKDPIVRELFRAFRALVRTIGPATVYAQKTRIVFQTRARFAGVLVRKNRLEVGLWLKRRREHPRLYRIEFYPPSDYVHRIRLAHLAEMDRDLVRFVREAYRVGRQEGPASERRTCEEQLSAFSRQPSAVSHQPSAISHQPSGKPFPVVLYSSEG